MALDPQMHIRQKFDEIIAQANKEAALQTASLKESDETEKLTPEQQVMKWHNALTETRNEIDGFETIEYYCFANNKMLLYKIFSYRIFCNKRNEEQNIRRGVILSEKYKFISRQLLKAKKQIPPFTYLKFLANKYDVLFYELNEQPYATSDDDYLKMCTWQINKKMECIFLEFNGFKENFLFAVANEAVFDQCIKDEISQLENIYHNYATWTDDQLKIELGRLKGLKNIFLDEDFSDFYQILCQAIKGDKGHFMQKPSFFFEVYHRIARRQISNPLIFCFSLLMYCRWLSDVLTGKADIGNNYDQSLDDIFHIGLKEGLTLGEIAVDKVKNKLEKQNINDKLYHKALKKEYNKQIKLLNELLYPDYFNFLEHPLKLRNCFINDCLYSIDTELPVEELKKAVVFNEILSFLDEEVSITNHNPLYLPSHLPLDKTQIVEIICQLAPSTRQIKKLLETTAMISDHCHNERIPLSFICKEINKSFSGIYKSAINEYKQSIGSMPSNKRSYFIVEQLRDIKYIERLCKIDKHKLNPYLKHIKHIDEDELEMVKDIQPYNITDLSELLDMKETAGTKPVSFGYRPGPKELKPILTAMDLQMNMLANGSTVDDFIEVLICKDLSKNTKKIYIGFTLIKFAYFRKKVEPWFSSFTPTNIERSGIFISSNEGLITARVLYNSTAILWEDSHQMDSIFDAKY